MNIDWKSSLVSDILPVLLWVGQQCQQNKNWSLLTRSRRSPNVFIRKKGTRPPKVVVVVTHVRGCYSPSGTAIVSPAMNYSKCHPTFFKPFSLMNRKWKCQEMYTRVRMIMPNVMKLKFNFQFIIYSYVIVVTYFEEQNSFY